MNLIDFWQNLPSYVSPSFSIFGFSIYYYSLAYILGLFTVLFLSKNYIKKKNININVNTFENILVNAFIAAIIGGRIFYVLFYNFSFYLENPIQIIWPFDSFGNFVGLSGMSFHGGLVFAFLYLLYSAIKKNFSLADFQEAFVPYVPLGFFYGRIANFLNGELYGRLTESGIGMYFNSELRHPSQLYEAFLEGLLLCFILVQIRKTNFKEYLGVFLVGFYVFFRFIVEFFREPDFQLGLLYGFSMGQILSVLSLLLVAVFMYYKKKR